jgi:hypothetical protein
MRQITWLALGYNVPVNPSRNRVYVWRKLKEFGAGYFKQGVALLPLSAQSSAQLGGLAARIRDMGGEATLAELKFCDSQDETRIISWFDSRSEREYRELLRDCAKIMTAYNQSLITPTERDEYLKKLGKRYKQARSRDYFQSHGRTDFLRGFDELLNDMANVGADLRRQVTKLLE